MTSSALMIISLFLPVCIDIATPDLPHLGMAKLGMIYRLSIRPLGKNNMRSMGWILFHDRVLLFPYGFFGRI